MLADDGAIVEWVGIITDIDDYAPMRYGMWDSGGWGVHLGLAGMTYNVSGNEGMHFRLKDRRQVLVGTQHPAEFAAGIAKASAVPHKDKIGKVTRQQVREIAQTKLVDLNTHDIDAAMRIIEGTARSMGIDVV